LCPLEHVVVGDVKSFTFFEDLTVERKINNGGDNNTDGDNNDNDSSDGEPSIESSRSSKRNGLENIEAMIICTSAVPRIRKRSLVAMLVKAPWRALRREPVVDIHSMRFAWKHGDYPEKVDYNGQLAQIDLAKKLGIPHVILVSTMGGTDPENFINSVGKITTKSHEKEGHGDILLWKRRAEKYLVESGLDYTILHPGHLVDTPGGLEEYVLGVDDELYELNHHKNSTSGQKRSVTRISREDVAELCVAALSAGKGKKKSFDCITMTPSAISTSTSSLLQPSVQTPHGGSDKTKRRKINPFSSAVGTSTSAPTTSTASAIETATSSQTTISAVSETTDTGRKPAEEVLNDFLDRSITTNYDLVA